MEQAVQEVGIEVTEAMVTAGVRELFHGLDRDGDVCVPLGPYSAKALARSIFEKMIAASTPV